MCYPIQMLFFKNDHAYFNIDSEPTDERYVELDFTFLPLNPFPLTREQLNLSSSKFSPF